jgi:predicted aldo/keto reductase-like oxidoreductase
VDKLDWSKLGDCLKDSPVADLIPDRLREAHALLQGEEMRRLSESS